MHVDGDDEAQIVSEKERQRQRNTKRERISLQTINSLFRSIIHVKTTIDSMLVHCEYEHKSAQLNHSSVLTLPFGNWSVICCLISSHFHLQI